MMETYTNIQEANQQIGALGVRLETEKEARAAVTADLQTARAAHLVEVETLKTQQSEELVSLRGENAKAVTDLTDKLEAANTETSTLTEAAKTADEKAADIVSAQGGDPVALEVEESKNSGPLTDADSTLLWNEYNAIPSAKVQERRDFYTSKIRSRKQPS